MGQASGGNRDNARIAARGMYLAAAELCRSGFNVTPTSRNMAGADLLITDDRCQNTWTIQIKVSDQTKKRRRGWLMFSGSPPKADLPRSARLMSTRPSSFGIFAGFREFVRAFKIIARVCFGLKAAA